MQGNPSTPPHHPDPRCVPEGRLLVSDLFILDTSAGVFDPREIRVTRPRISHVPSAFISCQPPEGRICVCVRACARLCVTVVTPEQCRDDLSKVNEASILVLRCTDTGLRRPQTAVIYFSRYLTL